MFEQVRYITNEEGERVGVLLDLAAYHRLANPITLDEECLIGLSQDELLALADSKLAPTAQDQLDDMLVQNAGSQLSPDKIANLDRLLAQIDQLTILKTRARYTLHRLKNLVTVALAHIFLLSYSDKFVLILEIAAPIAARRKR